MPDSSPQSDRPAIDILVVGGGPAGLTLAASLARAGVKPRIIDRNTTPPADRSRAMVIQPRTLELFDDLGIIDDAMSAKINVDEITIYSHSGRASSVPFLARNAVDSPYAGLFSLPQDQTERILGGLVARAGVTVEHGVTLESFTDSGDGIVASLLHADGTRESCHARWIVGCDGAHSTVRSAAGLTFEGITYPDECLLGDVRIEWPLAHDAVSLCPVDDGIMLVFPLPGDDHFRIIMILPRNEHAGDRKLERDEFERQLRAMTPRAANGGEPSIHVIESFWLTRYRLHRRGVPRYRVGRAFVAGDAAHIHSPAGGQGMNTGIQDAYNLGWKLALVARGDAPESLLGSYDGERRRIGELLLRGTDRMFGVMAGEGLFHTAVRELVPTIAARIFSFPVIGTMLTHFVSEIGIRYRKSALSVEGRGAGSLTGRLRAGDRAPDAEMRRAAARVRMFDLLRGPRHTLLLFAGTARDTTSLHALASQVEATYGSLVVVHVIALAGETSGGADDVLDAGIAHDKYGARAGAIYLVRPDGYIAFRGGASDGDALVADLARRFTRRASA